MKEHGKQQLTISLNPGQCLVCNKACSGLKIHL